MSTPNWDEQARQAYIDFIKRCPTWDQIDVDIRNIELRPSFAAIVAAALAAAYQAGRADGGKPQRVMVRPDVSVEPDNG